MYTKGNNYRYIIMVCDNTTGAIMNLKLYYLIIFIYQHFYFVKIILVW